LTTIAGRRAIADGSAAAGTEIVDPLLALLQRYEAELAAFDQEGGSEKAAHPDWDWIAENTWSRTQDEIIERQPPATTAAGALSALDHVLRNEYLFAEREDCAGEQMLWLLIKAARDYIAAAEGHDIQN
jgi:hypothetical protein